MENEEIQQRFREGRELFDAQRYFDCHEVWEDLWRESAGPLKQLLQGLIQAAVGYHHWQRRNAVGARRVWARSRRNLGAAAPLLSVEAGVAGLLQCLDVCLSQASDGAAVPRPHLAMDRLPLADGPFPAPQPR